MGKPALSHRSPTDRRVSTKSSGWPPQHCTLRPTKRTRTRGPRAAEFIETYCRITKDSVAGKSGDLLVLRPWQRQLLNALFAEDTRGQLRHRAGLIGVARKNGKSVLGACLGLEGLFLGPDGGEVYSCAGTRDQARIVFGTARRMVELDGELAANAKLYRDAIEIPATGSVYRVLSREAGFSEGLNPTRVIFDEVHVQPDDDAWNVMALAGGARVETMILGITTAGARLDLRGQDSFCYRLYQYGCRVASGETVDPSFFFAWWEPTLGSSADHTDPKVWAQANPGMGDLCSVTDFEATLPRTSEAEFRTKRTNVWVTSASAALPHGVWSRLAEPARQVDPDTPVVFMADGSWSGDSTAIIGVSVEAKPHIWVEDLWEKGPEDGREWRVPVAEVEEAMRRAATHHRTVEMGMDPYRFQRSMQILEDEGLPMLEYHMGSVERMVKAWKTFYDLALDGGFTHSGDPRLARHVDSMVLKIDAKGARPVKDSRMSTRHIDLGICAVTGIERAMWHAGHEAPTTESVYETRGLVVL
jgi:phage terminase large subunit-like protein